MSKINETKREKFLRLANYRTNVTLDIIRKMGNLSNKQSYEYEDKDINKIFNEIEKAIKETKSKFYHSSNKKKVFKL